MPSFCSVVGCSKRRERDNVRLFRIPAALKDRGELLDALSKERRACWIRALKRGDSETFLKNASICSKHFIKGEPATLLDKDNPDWIPSVNMGYKSINTKNQQAFERHERKKRRILNDTDLQAEDVPIASCSTSIDVTDPLEEIIEEQSGKCSIAIQTDLEMDYLEKVFQDINFCNEKLHKLEEKLNKFEISEEAFVGNDSKVLYFTGFPLAAMMFEVFEVVAVRLSTKSVLSPFKQFLLTLMKLRLNLPFKYLSYKFSVSPPTASDTFYKCLDVFYILFKELVEWPSREQLKKNVPACFKENFGSRVVVIIDCFEIFTETPSGFLNAAQCWSNYKHHQTIKFLIGITPHGTISYISSAWGGRTSDKFLTENCGFLNCILPGDIILADRGFLIQDAVEILGAHLEIPAFTKNKDQLHPTDLESTRKIANVRIHVERVIGLLKKKFKICSGPIPISMLSINRDGEKESLSAIDKILVVCSAFINLCSSQIPME